jgi:pimeloyl-ACP methyl ester carboxylesterase
MAAIEPITGQYVHVDLDGVDYRTYFERSGSGTPLVCLHTAGADSLEWRHLLVDDDVTQNHEVIAFDMPWHGRSLPPAGWWEEEYLLTRTFYMRFVIAFCEALGLDRPILVGCSMGGYVMLDLANEHPGRFGGLIAVNARAYEPSWMALAKWSAHPEVNAQALIQPVVRSISARTAPEEHCREVEWIYMRCPPGVLRGDLYYAAVDHDARPFMKGIDARAQRLYVIGGDWDWSCYQEQTDELAEAIDGLSVTRIPDAGHFPMSENPAAFKAALLPILQEIASAR